MMKSLQCVAMTVLVGAVTVCRAQSVYEIEGVLDFYNNVPEQIDAEVVINNGIFQVLTPYQPYDFQNTRAFTNNGVMFGIPGWQLDQVSGDTGDRTPLDSFYNSRNGVILSDYYGYGSLLTGPNLSSFLLISAKEFKNEGLLAVSSQGLLKITGENVDVSRSQLNQDLEGAGGGFGDFVTTNGYFNDVGIYDFFWGGPDVINLNLLSFYELDTNVGPLLATPNYGVTNPAGQGIWFLGMINPVWGAYTNVVSETNRIVQAGFVAHRTNLTSARVTFDAFPTVRGFAAIGAQVTMSSSNLVTGEELSQSLYFYDDMAQSTNVTLLPSAQAPGYFRPNNYRVSRVPLFGFIGSAGNAQLTTNYFYTTNMANSTVQAQYTAYDADVISGGGSYYPVPGAGISNTPGRLEIDAKNLNLELARGRANGLMAIKADHLVSSDGAQLQSANYSLNIASTNGMLRISSLVLDDAGKSLSGYFDLFSALWTNQISTVVTNRDPADPTNQVVVTNTVNIGHHVFLVDTSNLGATQRATTHNLMLRSTNVVVDDSFQLQGQLKLDAEHFTLNGLLDLRPIGGGLGATNMPRMATFTNNGTLRVANLAIFGADRPKPWKQFINRGSVEAQGAVVWADTFVNSGRFALSQSLKADAGLMKFEQGNLNAQRRMELSANDMKFHRHTNSTLGRLMLSATNSLSDSGGEAANLWNCGDGFSLVRKPRYGNLLGTRVQSSATRLAVANHTWPAEDRGLSTVGSSGQVNNAGWEDNLAIGRLTLSSGDRGQLRFHAPEPSGRYALYVDYLDLQGFVLNAYNRGRLGDYLKLDSNVTIYFAYANVPVEELDGELGGKVRWDPYFVGPNSSVTVLLSSGKTILVNRGLRESIRIDSDGDGIANGYDLTPFSEPMVVGSVTQMQAGVTAVVKWMAAPSATYVVQYTEDLGSGEWTPLKMVTNAEAVVSELKVEDLIQPEGARYYRVLYVP